MSHPVEKVGIFLFTSYNTDYQFLLPMICHEFYYRSITSFYERNLPQLLKLVTSSYNFFVMAEMQFDIK